MTFGALSKSTKRLIGFGALGVAVAAGAFAMLGRADKPAAVDSPPAAAASPATPAADPSSSSPGDPVMLTEAQSDQVRRFIADARRLAAAGSFTEAEGSLQKADKVSPNLPETRQARAEIAQMATPQGQLATQLTRARMAVEHGDGAAAEKALAEAERLKPDAPEIAELRQAQQATARKETHRNDLITGLLDRMREAIARHDFAAADSALNEAERIDLQDPTIHQARIELNRAHSAGQQGDQQK